MSSLDAITRRLRDDSRADFAFILTRKGRLLTADAPPEMPEAGRATCVDAARDAQAATSVFVELTMAREELVPYGGAAPVDVFIAPCGEAVVCLVLATWTDNSAVGPALDEHLAELSALLDQAKAARAGKRTGKTIAPPPRAKTQPPPAGATPARAPKPAPSSRGRGKKETEAPPKPTRSPSPRTGGARPPTMRPPAGRSASTRPRALSGLVELSKSGVRASERMQSSPTIKMRSERPRPPPLPGPLPGASTVQTLGGVPLGGRGSLPAIEIGESPLGRESLAAIEADGRARGSLPAIEIGEAPLGRDSLAAIEAEIRAASSLPSIEVAEAALGRESLEAIEADAQREGSMPSIEVGHAQLGRESLAAIEAEAMRKRSRTPAEIRMGEALLGRASQAAIESDRRPSTPEIHIGGRALVSEASLEAIALDERGEVPRDEGMTSSPDVEGGITPQASVDGAAIESAGPTVPFDGRATQPWAEAPEDAIRAAKATKAFAGGPQKPRMKTIPAPAPKLELTPPRIPPPPPAPPMPGANAKSRKRKHNSNVDLWHQALGGMLPSSEPPDEGDIDRDMGRDTIEDESTDPTRR